jgi:hypothetical protein
LTPASLHPCAPISADSLTGHGQLEVLLAETDRYHVWVPDSRTDTGRIFHQGDVGTEKTVLGLRRRYGERMFNAQRPLGDPRRLPFPSNESALAQLETYTRIASQDHLYAQLHNGMALVKAFLEQHWLIISLNQLKVLLGYSGIRPSKEGESYRKKKQLLRVFLSAYIQLLVRRFHSYETYVQGIARRADGKVDVDDYLVKFLSMVHKSNVDVQLKVCSAPLPVCCYPCSISPLPSCCSISSSLIMGRLFPCGRGSHFASRSPT